MKALEAAIIILAMAIPFAVKTQDLFTYLYWVAVSSAYLLYIAAKRW